MRMNFKMLLFTLFLSINVYSQSTIHKIDKVYMDGNVSKASDSFIEIDAEKELFILIVGTEKSYFKIMNVYFEPINKYSTLTLQGTEEVFTVVIYLDRIEKNIRVNFPDQTFYLTTSKY